MIADALEVQISILDAQIISLQGTREALAASLSLLRAEELKSASTLAADDSVSDSVTITQAAKHYAGTALTESALRRAVIAGEIPHVKAGKKYLITLSAIERWRQGKPAPPPSLKLVK